MRYALIDHYSGFVWGFTDADDIIEACRKVDHEVGDARGEVREYEEVSGSHLFANESAYIVHLAPHGWSCDDGQDQEAINEVQLMPVAGYVRVHHVVED